MAADGMVRLPGGSFIMANLPTVPLGRDDLAAQAVEVREFFMDAMVVTNAQFRAFKKAANYKTEAESFGWSFVLELFATDEAKAKSTQKVRDAPHWIAVNGATWRHPLGPGTVSYTHLTLPTKA